LDVLFGGLKASAVARKNFMVALGFSTEIYQFLVVKPLGPKQIRIKLKACISIRIKLIPGYGFFETPHVGNISMVGGYRSFVISYLEFLNHKHI
jgi:hypothetical protein